MVIVSRTEFFVHYMLYQCIRRNIFETNFKLEPDVLGFHVCKHSNIVNFDVNLVLNSFVIILNSIFSSMCKIVGNWTQHSILCIFSCWILVENSDSDYKVPSIYILEGTQAQEIGLLFYKFKIIWNNVKFFRLTSYFFWWY